MNIKVMNKKYESYRIIIIANCLQVTFRLFMLFLSIVIDNCIID